MPIMVITGASSGLGRVLTEYFASRSYTVCAVARRADKLQELVDAYPDAVKAYAADVAQVEQVQDVFAHIYEEHGSVDVLINNASVFSSCAFHEESLSTIDRLIDTNLKGTMYSTHAVLKAMVKQQHGHVINIASVSGTHGILGQGVYGASKHGVVGFSDVIGQEVKEHGVHVCAICPGGIDTPLWNESNPYPGKREDLIKPEELAELVGFVLDKPTLYKKMIMFPMCEWH